MPATLLLLRHAKSSWSSADLADFDRPLNGRGRDAAGQMGAFLAAEDLIPDLILCSAARRTRETLDRLFDAMGKTPDALVTARLYHASPTEMRSEIECAPAVRRLMVIGHNPGLQALAFELADREASDPGALVRLDDKYPTTGLAVFNSVSKDRYRLARFVRPRDLGPAQPATDPII